MQTEYEPSGRVGVAAGRRCRKHSTGAGIAVGTAAIQGQLVVLDHKTLRRHPFQVTRAIMHVEHALAVGALKMVMVVIGHRVRFITGVFPGQGHDLHLVFQHQGLQVAIDGGDT